MRRSLLLSALLHGLVLLLVIFGLPFSMPRKEELWVPVPIEIVNVSKETISPKPVLEPRKEEEKKEEVPKKEVTPPPPSEPTPPKEEVKPEPVEKPKEEPKPLPPVTEEDDLPPLKPEAKPQPKKIEPPKPVEKPKPTKKPEPKKKETSFDAVLKNLAKKKTTAEKSETEEKKEGSTSAHVGKVGAVVSVSEMDAVRRQISQCWNIPAGARDAQDLIVDVKVWMNPDGTVKEARLDGVASSNPFYRTAAESALRAVKDARCSPLKLPPEKYDQWKVFVLSFNPKDLL